MPGFPRSLELGLEALGLPRLERAERAETAIELIGPGGFESAYPKELSGGMRPSGSVWRGPWWRIPTYCLWMNRPARLMCWPRKALRTV